MKYVCGHPVPEYPKVPCHYCGGKGQVISTSGPRQADVEYQGCPHCEKQWKVALQSYDADKAAFSAALSAYVAGR